MDFHSAFADIDADGSGEISCKELEEYMRRKNYTETFVQKWLNLFDIDGDGSITYEEYCKTLGLTPKRAQQAKVEDETQEEIETTKAHGQKKATKRTHQQEKTSKSADEAASSTAAVVEIGKDQTDGSHKKHCFVVKDAQREKIKNGNYEISAGIRKFSRTEIFKKKALYRYVGKKQEDSGAKKTEEGESKPEEGKKGRRPRVYEAERAKQKKALRRVQSFHDHKRRLRASITPGTVLIFLAGPHKGKRVIFLKQLASGLLLVTGPFKYNGVPLRRVHQKLVIATRTKINVAELQIPERVDDAYFRHAKAEEKRQSKKGNAVDKLFAKTKATYQIAAERKEDQKAVDSQILKSIKATEEGQFMRGYLGAKFGLFKHDLPHKMVF